MGGSGSGMGIRFNTTRRKNFVEQYKSISARSFPFRAMQKIPENGIRWSAHGVDFLVLRDHLEIHHGEGENKRIFRIHFALSKGNYGNSRYWMRCPHPKCLKRCGKLYLCRTPNDMPFFLCRTCLDLAYRSQNKTALDRLIDKKWDLVHKLGANSFDIWTSDKPKWMHWKTFYKIKNKIECLHSVAEHRLFGKFGLM